MYMCAFSSLSSCTGPMRAPCLKVLLSMPAGRESCNCLFQEPCPRLCKMSGGLTCGELGAFGALQARAMWVSFRSGCYQPCVPRIPHGYGNLILVLLLKRLPKLGHLSLASFRRMTVLLEGCHRGSRGTAVHSYTGPYLELFFTGTVYLFAPRSPEPKSIAPASPLLQIHCGGLVPCNPKADGDGTLQKTGSMEGR